MSPERSPEEMGLRKKVELAFLVGRMVEVARNTDDDIDGNTIIDGCAALAEVAGLTFDPEEHRLVTDVGVNP